MKKILSKLFVAAFALLLFFSTLGCPFTTYAANESGTYLKNARFIAALHGQASNGGEIVISLYDTPKGENIAYINDGENHAYTSYVVQDAYRKDVGAVQQYTFNGTLVLDYFTVKGTPCLISDDGTIYVCENLDSYEISQLMDYD